MNNTEKKIKIKILTTSHGIVTIEVAPDIDVQALEKELIEKYGQFIQI